MNIKSRPLKIQISISVLQHLGMNLYSNVPAVLSEVVANAWDADARSVEINIDQNLNSITIGDDGKGMTRDEVIDQFLKIGYQRRNSENKLTSNGRQPMGRKGIGKLSTFSIAQVVDVYTNRNEQRTAFRMDRDAIHDAIANKPNEVYQIEEVDWPKDFLTQGTQIKLSVIDTKLTGMTVDSLKRRIARRFSIIGSKHDFTVKINDSKITSADRDYHNMLEYLWTYDDQADFTNLCTKLKRSNEDRTKIIKLQLDEFGLEVSGWIGTVVSPSKLTNKEKDNLNRIAIFMRGKLAQEDVLNEFGQKEIYADYVVGEIHCDALDDDDRADIATSNRQALKLDDMNFEKLRNVILKELRHIAGQWSDWRRDDSANTLVQDVPAVSNWLENLQSDTKKKARRWIGRLNTIRSSDESDKKELLKASILAFESYRRTDQIDRLNDISDESLSVLLPIFKDIDDLELSYYGQIVKMRLGVIDKLKKILKDNVQEKDLQNYLFKHLWLIDTSWERARGTENIETTVAKFLKENTSKLNKKERIARIDIAYRTVSGTHVIIELKRKSVAIPIDDLTKQIRKYRQGVLNALQQTKHPAWPLEIICLVGKPPPEWRELNGQEDVKNALKTLNARLVFYDQLINHAQEAYADYLEEHKKVDKLWEVFKSIDDYSA